MRIKRKFQGFVPAGKILDMFSKSKVDTYSCNKVNDIAHPVGSIYTSQDSTNPKDLFGGEWELIKTYRGGELLACCTVASTNGSSCGQNESIAFSDAKVGTKSDEGTYNYFPNIFQVYGGTILCKPQGIVGIIDVEMQICGIGAGNIQGFWWAGNHNAMPSGVSMNGGRQFLSTGPIGGNYGGNSARFIYKADDVVDEFFINPIFRPYGGTFTPSTGGTLSWLIAKAYARTGLTYQWKRTA